MRWILSKLPMAVDRSLLGVWEKRIVIREETASTNDDAMMLGRAGVASGTIVVAERQTSGRGRRGRVWMSAPGEALAFTMLVRPTMPRGEWSRLSLVAGLSVAEALESIDYMPKLKWPNDVLLGGKKVCGILVEAGEDFAVIGIGINVLVREFPEELRESATSLWLTDGRVVSLQSLLVVVAQKLEEKLAQAMEDFPALLDAVRSRCAFTGRGIRYLVHGEEREGVMQGWGRGGELLVENNGVIDTVIQADEVRLKE